MLRYCIPSVVAPYRGPLPPCRSSAWRGVETRRFFDSRNDVAQVVGSIFGGRKEPETRRCQTCERESKSRGTSPRRSKNGKGKGESGGAEANAQHKSGEGKSDAMTSAMLPCGHKHVEFAPLVSAVYIPVHTEYR